ncbi:hypothetical protein Pcinc_035489 [Petrolisthes cinctipes]|uniref:Ionotropic glutamate receptor L-glutamate and glycine-binding domain-containing protein n=1 Tax=Petrolisthes cinctipes TaxID=88211 RepID=A0AAE1BZT5_PETCI|nr:hypothetical protein Pcinc_035489 [Petrolisthes cinctipes]
MKRNRMKVVLPVDSLNTRMLEAISSALNFTYVMHESYDGNWGSEGVDGNWTGLVGELQHNIADFSTTITPTAPRLKVMRHVRIYASDPFVLLSTTPQNLPQYLALITPFTGKMWLAVLVSCLIFSLAFSLVAELGSRFKVDDGSTSGGCGCCGCRWIEQLTWAIFFTTHMLLENPPTTTPTSTSAKIMFWCWLVTCLIVAASYRSSLAAHLTVQHQQPPIDSFEDLVYRGGGGGGGWQWGSEVLIGASTLYFTKSTDPVVQEIYAGMQTHELDENMSRVLQGHYCFITTQFQGEYVVASQYTDTRGYTPVHTSATTYPKFAGTAWAVRRGAPFHRALTITTQRLIEAGLIKHWLPDVIVTRVKQERQSEER